MGAYAIRAGETQIETPTTPIEEYKNLSADQFTHFAKVYLKDNIMGFNNAMWMGSLMSTDKQYMNKFFEEIPDYLIDFSSDASRKLLMMYITTNMEYGFDCKLSELEMDNLFRCVNRLRDVDPRMIPR